MGEAKACKVLGLTSTGPGMNNLMWAIKILLVFVLVFSLRNDSEG